jgi:hypothetical protein
MCHGDDGLEQPEKGQGKAPVATTKAISLPV